MHVSEMMTCDWSMIIVDVLKYRGLFVELFYAVMLFVYLSNSFRHVYLRRQKFSFQTHTERKIGAGENGVDLWRLFLERVSWA